MNSQAQRTHRSGRTLADMWGIAGVTVGVFTAFVVTFAGTGAAQSGAAPGGAARGGEVAVGSRAAVTSLYGPTEPLGNGAMRAYVDVVDGVPVEMGVALTAAALEGLPTGHHDPGAIVIHDHDVMFEYVLDLPEGNPTPFRHVALNWNPSGHEPAGVYTTPHFDFHFNLITDAERRTITPEDPNFEAKGERFPVERQLPAGYVALPGAVPLMGTHWIDPTTPELNGQPFTETFIFGTWDGALIFAEPMITKAFIESRPDFREEIPVPADVDVPGYYPSAYAIRWNEATQEYRISLEGFVSRS